MSLAAAGIAETAIGAEPAAAPKKGGQPPKPRTLVAKASGRQAPEIR